MDIGDLMPPKLTANDVGIDPGAAGALGASNGLQQLMAMRLFRDQLAKADEQRRYERARQERLDAMDTRRVDQADARQAALDARTERAAKDAENKAMLAQVTQFPGAKVTGAQLETMGVGKNNPLRGSQFRNLEEMLAGRAITGTAGLPGSANATKGTVTMTPHEAIGPDTYEVRPTFGEEMKTAAADLAQQRAEIMRQLGEAKTEAQRQHWQDQLELMQQRINLANERGNNLTLNQQFNAINAMNKSYQTNTKAAREVGRQYQMMLDSWSGLQKGIGKGTAEQGIVATFNKVLDPNSVVREGEFDRTAQGQSLLQRMTTIKDNLQRGGSINPQVLQDMVTLAGTYARNADAYAKAEKTRVGRIAQRMNIPTDLIFIDEPTDAGTPGTGAGASTAGAGPAIGEVRTINGQRATWDGHGWIAK